MVLVELLIGIIISVYLDGPRDLKKLKNLLKVWNSDLISFHKKFMLAIVVAGEVTAGDIRTDLFLIADINPGIFFSLKQQGRSLNCGQKGRVLESKGTLQGISYPAKCTSPSGLFSKFFSQHQVAIGFPTVVTRGTSLLEFPVTSRWWLLPEEISITIAQGSDATGHIIG